MNDDPSVLFTTCSEIIQTQINGEGLVFRPRRLWFFFHFIDELHFEEPRFLNWQDANFSSARHDSDTRLSSPS